MKRAENNIDSSMKLLQTGENAGYGPKVQRTMYYIVKHNSGFYRSLNVARIVDFGRFVKRRILN
ncbi:MAG: hypothetical protein ACRDF4_03755 [Rhabdochlamydiaceae bacterium]